MMIKKMIPATIEKLIVIAILMTKINLDPYIVLYK